VLVALAIVAPLAFLLVAAYGDLHRQAETSARNVVNVLEARLRPLRRAQAGLEELAAETPLEALESAVSPALQRQVQLHWPCAPGIFRRSPDFA
jgi:type II secretory pathway component PulJ